MFVEEQPRQATPLMKQGDRFVVGLVGYKWAGVASGEWGITTTLEDCKHGSETQFGAGEIARRGMQLRPPAREVVYRSGQYSEGD